MKNGIKQGIYEFSPAKHDNEDNPMKLKLIVIVFLLMSSCCFASGWNDFKLDIGDGYYIFVANGTFLCREGKSNIIHSDIHDAVGGIVSYSNEEEFIFIKNRGKDVTKKFYFIVSKEDDEVVGPLSATEFLDHPNVLSVGTIDWKPLKNPHPWRAREGQLFFCLLSIPILAIGFFILLIFIFRSLIVYSISNFYIQN